MEASELNEILEQHKLWVVTNGMQGKRANLKGANLWCTNLHAANLQGANLRDANLLGANLTGANLTEAFLSGTRLGGADLKGSNFYRANLWRADLNGASLRYAHLQGANFSYADLRDVNLTGANLKGANLTGAILPDISWIIPGCLVQLNRIKYDFFLEKEGWVNFVQDSFGFFIQDNVEEKTFDMLVEDRVIRGIPDWAKYSGLNKLDP